MQHQIRLRKPCHSVPSWTHDRFCCTVSVHVRVTCVHVYLTGDNADFCISQIWLCVFGAMHMPVSGFGLGIHARS